MNNLFDDRILENQADQIVSNLVQQEPEQPEQLPQEEIVEAQKQDTSEQRNFKALREARERAERERDEAVRRLQELQQPQQAEEEDISLGNDDLAEGKHLKKVTNKIKKLEEQLKNYQQQSLQSSLEIQLKTQYPDFEQVVSKDNVDQLIQEYPELGASLKSSPDIYNKAVTAYKLIKKFGIYADTSYDIDKEKAQRNAAKPRAMASVSPQQGESPMSRANAFANGLTPELKKQLLKEMAEAVKKY